MGGLHENRIKLTTRRGPATPEASVTKCIDHESQLQALLRAAAAGFIKERTICQTYGFSGIVKPMP